MLGDAAANSQHTCDNTCVAAPAISPALSYRDARAVVVREVCRARPHPTEAVPLEEAAGRVLGTDVLADRDYPTLDRTARDGFAVRSADMPGRVRVVGEVRAGGRYSGAVGCGEAVEIMTGAPIPEGADAVVMVEHVTRDGDYVVYGGDAPRGQFVNYRAGEAKAGSVLLRAGTRIGYAEIALLASVGNVPVTVYAQPRIAILATGDELVGPEEKPAAHQIRNSNVYSLAAQVKRAGGIPEILGVARDEEEETRGLIDRGLASDLLLLSGGVSAGKYDVVEQALRSLGAEFFFTRVAIQPGQPLVFGKARDRFFFGLPGNPASTMVTFELFARTAVEALGGQAAQEPVFTESRLTRDYRHRPGLMRFLPALVSAGGELTPIAWTGSSDIAALTRANAFMVVDAERSEWKAGERMPVLLK
jgi:molybdopterin molybdotransferase